MMMKKDTGRPYALHVLKTLSENFQMVLILSLVKMVPVYQKDRYKDSPLQEPSIHKDQYCCLMNAPVHLMPRLKNSC